MPPLLILYLAFHWSMNCDAVCTMSKFNKKLRYTVFHSLTLEWQKYEHSPLISERLFPRVAQRLIRSLNFGSGWWVHVLRCVWATWSPLWSSASYHTPSGDFFFFFFCNQVQLGLLFTRISVFINLVICSRTVWQPFLWGFYVTA